MAIVSANGAATPLSPNYIINSAFDVNQRNFSSSTTTTYGFDRWVNNTDGTGATFTAQTFPLGAAPVQGQEARNYVQVATTGQSSSTTYTIFTHRIEDVRTLAGQTATVSFWAKAASGTPKIAVEFEQNFGTGGSTFIDTPGGAITLNTSWNRYSTTVAIPSVAGKTIGANNNLELNLWTSAGSTYSASRASSIGIQSATIAIWGVQVEAGSIATPFRKNANSLQSELAACQRYFWRFTSEGATGNYMPFGMCHAIDSGAARGIINYPVTMRIAPAMAFTAASTFMKSFGNPMTSIVAAEIGINAASFQVGRTSEFSANQAILITASNTKSAYIEFNAEL